MTELSNVMAKLSGIKRALISTMNEDIGRNRTVGRPRTRPTFPPNLVEHYFTQAAVHLKTLKELLPDLYGDFQTINIKPNQNMSSDPNGPSVLHFSRSKVERLVRDIDQIFEIRANCGLEQPKQEVLRRVFISHGHSSDWRKVQPFIEKDVSLQTIELEQEVNAGRTIIEKLISNAKRCDSAVIVMTGDDHKQEEEAKVRENVMHEIGFFQGSYGRHFVILLHEEGVNIPTNLSGVAYVAYPKDSIESGFHVLQRELKAIYKL